ncbi:MAG TPA: GGDEF domain-containing protein [Dongiaceae bacterium]|jgi:diguanylate cyclase (GGDEF)-like protein|nr:GGDEF domain-containing protein [Dongiaceae bacterium]
MRIRDNLPPGSTARVAGARPVARARGAEAASAATATATATSAQADQATFLGLHETELSPNVRAALQALLDEVGRLRQELELTRKRISHLERMADEDSMLPIANRRAFVRELTRLISYCERYGTAGSVLYFDLNGMKDINDRYGHPAGDEVLRHFARLLVANVRDSDVVGRLGGDEFGVILAQADENQARDKAGSLVDLVNSHPVAWQGETLQLSCAVGIHQFSARQNADEALSKADADMYDEKRRYYAELNKQR